MGKSIYNYEYLKDYCTTNNVILNKDYSCIFITRDSQIEGKCSDCENNFNKVLRQLLRSGAYCKLCTKNKGNERCINTCLKRYGVKNSFQLEETKEKIKQTCIEKYGDEYHQRNKNIKEKIKKTIKEKYGVEHISQLKETKEKFKNTCIDKYGVENPGKNEEIKNKIKQTNLNKYGVEYATQSKEIIQKIKNTLFKNFGVEYPIQSEIIKEQIKQTNLEKYGVENSQQNPEIADKASKNSYSKKNYILPSGNIIHIQGYEHFALDELIKIEKIDENHIVTGTKNVPTIWYEDKEGKKHRHYVDIYIPNQNRCIEVKSTWTANKKKDNIFLKQKAAQELGYNYEIWIYDAKGTKIQNHIQPDF